MADSSTPISITLNGVTVQVSAGTTVAAAIMNHAAQGFRKSVQGEWRSPLCGMGICYECRAQVDGIQHTRTCMVVCQDGMVVEHG